MKSRRSLRIYLLNFSAIFLLVETTLDFARAQECYTNIYSDNSDYVEVSVDTRSIAQNEYLQKVRIHITFRISGKNKRGNYNFTDADLQSLPAGHLYRRYFPVPSGTGSPVQIVAGKFEYTILVLGGAAANAVSPETKHLKKDVEVSESNARSGDVTVYGSIPPKKEQPK